MSHWRDSSWNDRPGCASIPREWRVTQAGSLAGLLLPSLPPFSIFPVIPGCPKKPKKLVTLAGTYCILNDGWWCFPSARLQSFLQHPQPVCCLRGCRLPGCSRLPFPHGCLVCRRCLLTDVLPPLTNNYSCSPQREAIRTSSRVLLSHLTITVLCNHLSSETLQAYATQRN